MGADLARAGLEVLAARVAGRPHRAHAQPAASPSTRDLVRLYRREVDGFEAASIAWRVRASEEAKRELATLASLEGLTTAKVRLAASEATAMRDPSAGALVRTFATPDGELCAEVYLFSGDALAIYAAERVVVRLEAPSARTDSMQVGYWAGQVQSWPLHATLHVGDRTFELHLAR
jgi:hypothetical protein